MMLLTNDTWGYDMVISGFILGTIIFASFLWTAIQNFISVKQIYKFEGKTENIYKDNLSKYLIRALELTITIFWVALVAFFIASLITHSKYKNNPDSQYWNNTAGAIAITHDVMFLVDALLIVIYLGVAYYFNGSMIVVADENNLITANNIIAINMVTVSRIIGHNFFFKITYRDANLKGNLKEVKLRYTKRLEQFLISNGFYQGEAHD